MARGWSCHYGADGIFNQTTGVVSSLISSPGSSRVVMDSLSVFSWYPYVQTRCVGRTCAYLTCLACQFVLWESWYSVADCDLYWTFRILPTPSPPPALSQVAFVVCFASLDTLPEGWTLVLVGYGFSHLFCSLKGRTCEVRFSVVAVLVSSL